jgi:hypothetical protein
MKPPLVVFCGVPGSGKTTIARIVCGRIPGAVHIQTDAIRRMIARPKYTRPESAFVYDSCIQVAKKALASGRPVVLDGTFSRSYQRVKALTELQGLYGQCFLVHVMCSFDTARLRNASRMAVVPEERWKGINAHFEEPLKALKLDTEAHSAEENAGIVLSALAHEVGDRQQEYSLEPAAAV